MKNLPIIALIFSLAFLASCANQDNPYLDSLNRKGYSGDPCFPLNAQGDAPRQALLTGSSNSEKLVGTSHTDDVLAGHGGGDLFPITLGNDILVDFDPHEDVLDIGNLGRSLDDFVGIQSLDELKAASKDILIDDSIALEIDVDGEFGHSTTTLLGVSLSDMSDLNVFFDASATAIPPLVFTAVVERHFIYPTGDTLAVAHGVCNSLES